MGVLVGASGPHSSVRAQPAIRGITLESSPGDPEAAVGGQRPSISDDGHWVAFVGPPPTDDGRTSTAYLRDRDLETLVELTPSGAGMRHGDTVQAVISSDGCSVTVLTQLPLNLFSDDDLGDGWDVYRAELPGCATDPADPAATDPAATDSLDWEVVSTDVNGAAANDVDPTSRISVSATGTVVGYVVPAARKSDLRRAVVADLTVPAGTTGRIIAVPGLPDGEPRNGSSYIGQIDPAVSGDGLHVAFTSDALADAPTPEWAPVRRGGDVPATQVYIWDRDMNTVDLVSGLPGAAPGSVSEGISSQPSVSENGSLVAFTTTSVELVAARYPECPLTGCVVTQVLVRDRDANDDGLMDDAALLLASRRPTQRDTDSFLAGDGASSQPSLSADGSIVAFVSRAGNLLASASEASGQADDGDIIVVDLGTGRARRASVRPDAATPAEGANNAPALSATGRVVTFETGVAGQMVPGTPAGNRQVVSTTFPTSLSMPALDVGTVPAKWPSPEWFVTVTNTGTSSFVPARIETTDKAFEITGGSCFAASVPPGGTCSVRVVFTPGRRGDYEAVLTVAEDGFNAAKVSAVLRGSGGEPYLSATPAGVGLDDTLVGAFSAGETITVANTGYTMVVVQDVTLTGPNAEDFAVVSTTCPGASLEPTAKCEVVVSFLPKADGLRAALLTISTTNGSRTSVVLGGTASYKPEITAPAEVRTGRMFTATGSGFSPDTPLVLSWADGSGRDLTVRTDATGAFTVRIPLMDRDRPGQRELVVSDPANRLPTVRTTVMVRPG